MNRDGAIVYVVEDDPGIRRSLQMVMESAGLGTVMFGTAEDFLHACTGGECGCVVLDLRLPGMSGLELMERLRSRQHPIPVIMITGHGDVPAAVHSMKLGAIDFIEKPFDHHGLVDKVRAAISEGLARRRRQEKFLEAQARLAVLTERERELLMALIRGRSSKQIAAEMELSLRTVENHRAHLLAKTGAENTADLVRLGMLAGLMGAGHSHRQ